MKALKLRTVLILLIVPIVIWARSTDSMTLNIGLEQNYHLIPMSKLITGHDVVEASINDQTGLFIVDTGAITIINNRMLHQYNIDRADKIKTQQAAGAGGLIEIDSYPINELVLGGHPVPVKQLGSTDLDTVILGLFNVTGKMIDGLIGQDVLIAMHAVIDVTEQRLYFKKSAINQQPKDMQRLEQAANQIGQSAFTGLSLNSLYFTDIGLSFLTIEVTINSEQGLFIIDSGASRTMLSSTKLANFGLDAVKANDIQSSSGAGGAFSLQNITVPPIKLLGFVSSQSNIYHSDLSPLLDFISEQTGIEVAGVLGQDILLKHQALIDVGEQMLYLKE